MEVSARPVRSSRGWLVPGRPRDGWGEPLLLTAPRERAQDRRLLWLLIGVWIVNLFDLGFTLLAVEQRILVELNPVAARLLPYGPGAVACYKLGLLAVGTVILWRCRRHRIAETAAWVVAVLCVALSLVWYKVYLDAEPRWVELSILDEVLPYNNPVKTQSALDSP